MLNFIKNRLYREYVVKKFIYRRYPRYKKKKIKMDGISFLVPDVASFLAIWYELFINRIYSFDFNNKESKKVIVDFGANIGLSVYFFNKYYENAEIYAFEADPEVYYYLQENVKQFSNGRIHLYNKAVSNSDESVLFFHEGADAGRLAKKGEKSIEVESVDANKLLSKFHHIDMLKVDIEGSERIVIPSIKNQFYKIDNIFLEYHSEVDQEQCLIDILNFLKEFRLYIQTGFSPRCPLNKIDNYMGFDLELNIFGVKIK